MTHPPTAEIDEDCAWCSGTGGANGKPCIFCFPQPPTQALIDLMSNYYERRRDIYSPPDHEVQAAARAIAPMAWRALGSGDTLAQQNRRKASIKHATAALKAAMAVRREGE